ncbi:hypothetical protein Calkr_0139 [Caldicellulosiruptor acetigenus I77R1B]|uniref:Uncharacterized protein n=1 Tax=Caldicellulosiruptor acetigenus (strain ATCC 700853 / DSM 12137 / I77R1B) TaxID=632335 RepID=E4S6F3_CALA7|nr:hypothetical protein [Caldicellulosiruptor acetigenus]ADQ39711.1 hypothetical protein Calkr_0139 [Caldicellulosiruptor acetigenus I77R1B]
MKLKRSIKLLITFVVVLSVVISSVAYSQTNSTALLKAGIAYLQAQNAKTVDEEIRIDFRLSAGKNATAEDKKLEEFLKKMYIKARVVADVYNYETNMALNLYYNNKQVLSGSIYVNKELAVYNFPQIYSKPLYVKLSDAYKNMPIQIDVEKYTKLFDVRSNKQLQELVASYAEVLMPKLAAAVKLSDKKVEVVFSDGKKQSCSEVIFEFNKDSSLEIVKAILTKAANDAKTKEFILQVLKLILEDSKAILQTQMLSEGEGLKPEDFNVNEILNQVSANYTQAVSSAVYVIDEVKPQIPPFTLQYRIMIDDKNNLKGERLYFYLKDSNGFKIMFDMKGVINSINANIKVPKIDISKGIDMTKLTDKDFEIMQKNLENIFKKLGLPIEGMKM